MGDYNPFSQENMQPYDSDAEDINSARHMKLVALRRKILSRTFNSEAERQTIVDRIERGRQVLENHTEIERTLALFTYREGREESRLLHGKNLAEALTGSPHRLTENSESKPQP
jgi:hypothetical protein